LKEIKINPDKTPHFFCPHNFENTISILRIFLNYRHKLHWRKSWYFEPTWYHICRWW